MAIKRENLSEERKITANMVMKAIARHEDASFRDAELIREIAALPEPVVLAEWGTKMSNIISRLEDHFDEGRGQAILLIRQGQRFEAIRTSTKRPAGIYIPSDEVHDEATIGHVFETLLAMESPEWNTANLEDEPQQVAAEFEMTLMSV